MTDAPDSEVDFFDDQPAAAKRFKRPLTQRAYFPWLVVLGILVVLLAIFPPVVLVRSGHAGVATFFGEVQGEVYSPGLHAKYPLLRIHQLDTREQKFTASAEAESQDLQLVKVTVALNYRLHEEELKDIYAEVGEELANTRLEPAIQEAIGNIVADFTAAELVSDREDFKIALAADLDNHLADESFQVESLAVTEITFAKALQDAYTARAASEELVETAELERQAAVIRAETATLLSADEVERIQVIGDALRGREAYLQYEILQKWDGKTPLSLSPTITSND
jgi:prohibitin 1